MNSAVKKGLIVGAVGLVMAGGIFGFNSRRGSNIAQAGVGQELAIPVTVTQGQFGEIAEEVFTIGEVVPEQTYQVNALVSGKVTKTNFQVGDTVKAGQVMFVIDKENYDTDRSNNLSQLSNGLTQAKTAMDDAKKSYEDQKVLHQSGAISSDALSKNKTAYDNAVLSYQNALSNYNSTASKLNKNEENYVITSPVDGVVTAKNVEIGAVASNQSGYTVVVTDQYKIDSSITSKHVNRVSPGQPVEVYVNTLDRTLEGEVVSVSYMAVKGSYPLEIVLKESPEGIQPGMYAELSIETAREEAVTIPAGVLLEDEQGEFVYLVESDRAVKRYVQTGTKSSGRIVVYDGLQEEDAVVLKGKEFLDDGKKVMVQ